MKRREFLTTTATASAVALVPVALIAEDKPEERWKEFEPTLRDGYTSTGRYRVVGNMVYWETALLSGSGAAPIIGLHAPALI